MATTKQAFEPGTKVAPAPSPGIPPTAGQATKGIARKTGLYLAEPAFIAGCGVAGALFEVQHGSLHGDAPVIGMAAAAAGFATVAGTARFLVKAYRTGTHAFGGFAIRAVAMLLCVGIEVYGLSCWCDDVSQATHTQEMVRFE